METLTEHIVGEMVRLNEKCARQVMRRLEDEMVCIIELELFNELLRDEFLLYARTN